MYGERIVKMKPARIWGCKYLGKIGRYYRYMPLLGYCPLLGGNFQFEKFPTKERVCEIFKNVIGFNQLVS